ncbi:hypothetical protein H4R33_002433 [Dimargaris cristalligena]|nr:hypothetical protein H4R33_002433 [Dimargaris cristalligena]
MFLPTMAHARRGGTTWTQRWPTSALLRGAIPPAARAVHATAQGSKARARALTPPADPNQTPSQMLRQTSPKPSRLRPLQSPKAAFTEDWVGILRALREDRPEAVWEGYRTIGKGEKFYAMDNYRFQTLLLYFTKVYQRLPEASGPLPPTTAAPWTRVTVQTMVNLLCEDWFAVGVAAQSRSALQAPDGARPTPMVRRGHTKFQPFVGQWCHQVMINALCSVGLPDNAFALLEEMIKIGETPASWIVRPLLRYYLDHGRSAELLRLINVLEDARVDHHSLTFPLIFRFLVNQGEVDRAMDLLAHPRLPTGETQLTFYGYCLGSMVKGGHPAAADFFYSFVVSSLAQLREAGQLAKWVKYLGLSAKPTLAIDLLRAAQAYPALLDRAALQPVVKIFLLGYPSLTPQLDSVIQEVPALLHSSAIAALLIHGYLTLNTTQPSVCQRIVALAEQIRANADQVTEGAFNCVLRSLFVARQTGLVGEIYRSLRARGCQPTGETLLLLSNLENPEAHGVDLAQTYQSVDRSKTLHSPRQASLLMRALVCMGRNRQVLTTYQEVTFLPLKAMPFSHEQRSYVIMIEALAQAGHVAAAWELVNSLTHFPAWPSPTAQTCTVLLNHCLKVNDHVTFDHIRDFIKKRAIRLDWVGCNQILKGAIQLNRLDELPALMVGFSQAYGPPRADTYSLLIIASANHGHLDLAEQYIGDVKRQALALTPSSLCKIIYEFAKRGDTGRANYYIEMLRGIGSLPDGVVQSSLICAQVHRAEYQEAWAAYREALDRGVTFDRFIYEPVTYALIQLKQLGPAADLFALSLEQGYVPDALTLNTLLTRTQNSAAWNPMYPRLEALFYEIQLAGEPRLILAWNGLFQRAISHGDVARVTRFWAELQAQAHLKCPALTPDHATLSLLIDACRMDLIPRLADVQDFISHHGMALDTNNYTSLAEYYCVKGRPEAALALLRETMPSHRVGVDQKLIHNLLHYLLSYNHDETLEKLKSFIGTDPTAIHLKPWLENFREGDEAWLEFCRT